MRNQLQICLEFQNLYLEDRVSIFIVDLRDIKKREMGNNWKYFGNFFGNQTSIFHTQLNK